MGRWYCNFRPAVRESFSEPDTKQPVVCVTAQGKEEKNSLPSTFNIVNEEMQALLSCEELI